jgi:hypothetical protein
MAGLVEQPASGFVIVADEQAQQPGCVGWVEEGIVRRVVIAGVVTVGGVVSPVSPLLQRGPLAGCDSTEILPVKQTVHQPLALRQHQAAGKHQQQRGRRPAQRTCAGPVHGMPPAAEPISR